MPYLVAPVSGTTDPNGNSETPRMDLAIVVSGKEDNAYVDLVERLPTIFPGPQWNPARPSYRIVFIAFGSDAHRPLYYGGKSRKNRRKNHSRRTNRK